MELAQTVNLDGFEKLHHLVHFDVALCAGLKKLNAELVCKRLAL